MPAPRVTVSILSYDGMHLLAGLLPSVAAQTYADMRTVVVDNGSSDGTPAWLAQRWPDVECVALAANVGVTAGLNRCVRAAEGSELLLLLNNDMELDPECVGELVRALDEHPGAGSAAPKLVDFHDRGVLDGAGDVFAWRGTAFRRGHGEPDRGQFDRAEPIFGACGGGAMYRMSAFDTVGLFDERFFAFHEDADWNLRAQVAGLGCRYVPTAVAYHMGSATIGKGLSDFTRYHLWRNSIWTVAKAYPAAALARHAADLLLTQAFQFADAARARRLEVWWRALRDGARGLPQALRDRRRVQRARRATLRDLDGVIESTRAERARARRPARP